jgi:hypothetical protein
MLGLRRYRSLAGIADPMHVPDRRPGTIPAERLPGEQAGKGRTMAKPRRGPCWDNVERFGRLLVSAVNALAQLLDAIHRVH